VNSIEGSSKNNYRLSSRVTRRAQAWAALAQFIDLHLAIAPREPAGNHYAAGGLDS